MDVQTDQEKVNLAAIELQMLREEAEGAPNALDTADDGSRRYKEKKPKAGRGTRDLYGYPIDEDDEFGSANELTGRSQDVTQTDHLGSLVP